MTTRLDDANPYVGPRPFRPEEQNRFFGRDREASELLALIMANPAILLYAQSGAGKTSLINARLIPRLEQEGFQVFPIARVSGVIPQGVQPEEISNLYVYHTLLSWKSPDDDPGPLVSMSLAEFLAARPHPTDEVGEPRLRVLLFDQFEELFTLYPDHWKERDPFFRQIAEVLGRDPLLRVVFALREDYLAELDRYARWLPENLRARFRMERLREAPALEAVKRPLERTGRRFAEGVAEKLVQNLLLIRLAGPAGLVENPGEFVEPVQLQVVCSSIWRPDVTEITAVHLEQFGAVDKALANFYENAVRSAAAKTRIKEALIRTWCERALVTPLGTRNMVLEEWATTEGLANVAVHELERQRLIRREERAGARWWELTHDRLINPIQDANAAWREQESAKRWRTALPVAGIVAAIFIILLGLGLPAVIGREIQQSAKATTTVVAGAATEGAQQAAVTVQAAETVAATRQAQQAQATVTRGAQQAAATVTQGARQVEATTTQVAQQAAATAEAIQKMTTQISFLVRQPLDTLRSMLTSPTPGERAAAAQALGQKASAQPELAAEVASLLSTSLSDDKDPTVRQVVAQSLGQIGPYIADAKIAQQAAQALNRLLSDPNVSVQQAAQQALKRINIPIESFVGRWTNANSETSGITTIDVTRAGNRLSFRVLGSCRPRDCDWGAVTVPYEGVAIVVPYVFDFASTTLTITLEQTNDQLVVDSFTHFTDSSGRKDYGTHDVFVRSAAVLPTPTLTPIPSVIAGDKLFVALFWERDGLAIIDASTGGVEQTIAFDSINARYLSANPGRQEVYVSFANGDTFYVLDARTGTIKGKIKEEVGWNASNSVVSPDGRTVYLATSGGPKEDTANKILVLDPQVMKLKLAIRLGPYNFPNGLGRLEISPDGRKLYSIDRTAGKLVVVDTATSKVETSIPAPGTLLLGISPDGTALYTFDQRRVSKIQIGDWNTAWNVVVGDQVSQVAVMDNIVYIPDTSADQVICIDGRTGGVLRRWNVDAPSAIALSVDGTRAYVTSTKANKVYFFDTASGTKMSEIDVRQGSGPTDIVLMSVRP